MASLSSFSSRVFCSWQDLHSTCRFQFAFTPPSILGVMWSMVPPPSVTCQWQMLHRFFCRFNIFFLFFLFSLLLILAAIEFPLFQNGGANPLLPSPTGGNPFATRIDFSCATNLRYLCWYSGMMRFSSH